VEEHLLVLRQAIGAPDEERREEARDADERAKRPAPRPPAREEREAHGEQGADDEAQAHADVVLHGPDLTAGSISRRGAPPQRPWRNKAYPAFLALGGLVHALGPPPG